MIPNGAPASCNITATGTILANGSLGGSPLLGDVYQIQGTIKAHYVDDDEVSNSTLVVTAPDGIHKVTSGLFLLNAHRRGLNTYAARVAAGYESSGVWVPGTWTWEMNFRDRAGNTCTASGSYDVSPTFDNANGFLRQHAGTLNFVTDGNNQAFWPTGIQWYPMSWYGSVSGSMTYNSAEIPALAHVNVNGTDVEYVSGARFNTSTQPSSVFNQIYICPTGPGSCTYYGDVTIHSSIDLTLPSNGGNYSNVQAYLGFVRDFRAWFGASHPFGYNTTLANAAQFLYQWGNNISRFANHNQYMPQTIGSWLGTGFNTYNYTNTGTRSSAWGLPAVDLWFAAAHAAGIHLVWGGMWISSDPGPCPSYVCTSAEQSNLQHYYAMIAARYGAFYDILELTNESRPPQAWTDTIAAVLNQGVPGINGGAPADPYRHLFTLSFWPPSPGSGYSPSYGPGTANPDANLTVVDMMHATVTGGVQGTNTPIYTFQKISEADNGMHAGCPGNVGNGNTLPRWQGEGETGIGIAPSTVTVVAPNDEANGPRIVDETYVMNQCGFIYFGQPSDFGGIDSARPAVNNTWLDLTQGRRFLQQFMQGLDPDASRLNVTLGGGCAANKCSYAALGSSSHIRIELNSSTGDGRTGIPNAVNGGTITFSVPQPNMTGKWWNPATGSIIGMVASSKKAGTKTFTVPNFNVDMWFQLDSSSASKAQ